MYPRVVARSGRLAVKNPFGVVCISVATSLAVVPLVVGTLVGGVVGALVGLWTCCLILGFVTTGSVTMAVAIVTREISLGTSEFVEGVKNGQTMGPAVGVGTFVVSLLAVALAVLPLSGVVGWSAKLVGVYLVASWYVVAMVALVHWASDDAPSDVRTSFVNAVDLIFRRPALIVWIPIQSIGWLLLSIPLLIFPFVVTPGLVTVIGTAMVVAAREETVEVDGSRHTLRSKGEPSQE